jgi:N-acetyl sugar amidotransferase
MPGANRPYGWAKYLNKSGYYPIIITRRWDYEIRNPVDILRKTGNDIIHEKNDEFEVYYLPYKQNFRDHFFVKYGETKFVFIRKFLTLVELVFQNFTNYLIPFKNIYSFADSYLSKNKDVRIIIATGAPFVLFKFAYYLNKKHLKPWIADYRDDWFTDELNFNLQRINKLLRKLESRSERKWVGSTIYHTAVSPHSVLKNSRFLNKEGFTIHNGYFFEDRLNSVHFNLYDQFTICFIGTLYPTQKIEIFLDGFIAFIEKNHRRVKIKLLFPGLAFDLVQKQRLANYLKGYESFFEITERVPKKDIIEIQNRTHVFLYCAHDVKGVIGSKIYDYIGLKKPVIFSPSDKDIIENIFTETGVGIICNDAISVCHAIEKLDVEFSNGKYYCPQVNEERINYYSRQSQTKILAGLFDSVLVREYQQCTRCVMDTSDSEITFDDKGYCNHCNDYFENISKRTYQGKTSDIKLAQLIEKIKRSGKNKQYDCIIGISGGVDSIYTAILAKKQGLKPLAVHMDNGWNTELAVSNIEKTLKKLDIDLYTFVLDWEEFRDLQLAFLKASVPEIETPTDIAIPAILHKVAVMFNIKYIFSGGNFVTEGILPKSWHYNPKDIKYLKALYKKYGVNKLKTFPTFGFQKEMYYKIVRGIKMIYPLNYIPYNKKEAVHILENELNWKNYGGKHHESVYTRFVQSYILPEKFGFDYRRATFSSQICSGEISRNDALLELEKKPYDLKSLEEEKIYISKKLGISLKEFDEIMNLPSKTFKDYPNDKKKLEFIYNIYRKFN